MKTRIGTTFGLALMVALGIIATMLALGMFTSSKVGATHDAGGASDIHLPRTTNTAINVPNTPGAAATYTLRFQNVNEILAGSGQIYVKFDSLVSVPSSIEKERITISTTGGATSNPLIDPTVSIDSAGDTVIAITLGDTDPASTGTQNLPIYRDLTATDVNEGHTLQFSQLAGITNSTVTSTTGPLATVWVNLSDDGVTYDTTNQPIPGWRHLSMTSGGGARGTSVTITGRGFTDGGTATVFREGNVNNRALDAGEAVLATSDAAIAGGEFTATFSVDTNFVVGNNSINAIDGGGISANNPAQGARFESQNWALNGAVSLSSATATRGGSLTITLSDITGASATQVTIGGVQADLSGVTTTITNNTTSFAVTVPSTTPLGTQSVAVTADGEGLVAGVPTPRFATLEVGGLTLVASPSTAVAGQVVTVSGSGFTASGTVANGGITVGGVPQAVLSNGAAETTVTMDNSGNLVASFTIPNNDVTRTPGSHILSITDSGNRIGEATITVPSRTVTLDPASSKRGSSVSFTGSGYIASTTVTITHGIITVATVTADAAGGITGSFTVPTGAGIPSANTVVATSACTCDGTDANGGINIQRAGASTHSVPGAVASADPTSAAPGEIITVTGTGFPGFVAVDVLTIGGVSAKPSPAPASDTNGGFTASVLVPELAVGSHSMVVTVGTGTTLVTATTSFTISAAPTVTVVSSDDTETVFAAEVTADNLVRVWWYSNELQAWSFYDPRPAFAMANTYTTAMGGEIVWVNVTAQTTFQGQTLFPGWNLIALD